MGASEVHPFVLELRRTLGVGFPLIIIVTHEETRALQMVQAAAGRKPTPVWTSTHGFGQDIDLRDPASAIAWAGEADGTGIYAFLDLHAFLDNPTVVRSLRDFAGRAEQGRKAIVMITPSAQVPFELEKEIAVLDLPLPYAIELASIWAMEQARLTHKTPVFPAEALVRAAGGLALNEAHRAFRLALHTASPKDALVQVISEKRRVLRRSATLDLVDVDVGLEDVGGLEALKVWLKSRVVAFGDEAKAFGLPEPRGMLVCGVQGCGKSLVTKAAAAVFGLPLVRMNFAAVFATASPEASVRQAMRITEAIAPVVLWVDEIEKGLSVDLTDGRQARVFGDFLVWLQEKRAPVFVAATANDVERLPPELARRGRFDEVFFVDLPAAKERQEILGIHLRRRGRDPEQFPLEKLTKPLDAFSGAELEQVVIAGMFRAFSCGRDLREEDLHVAATETVPLATMYEEKVQALRTWANARARRASADRRTLELFED